MNEITVWSRRREGPLGLFFSIQQPLTPVTRQPGKYFERSSSNLKHSTFHVELYYSTQKKKKAAPYFDLKNKKNKCLEHFFCLSDLKDFQIYFHFRPISNLYLKQFRS